ncbi:hypothetical protein M0R45_027772 [Rubus argutus]|uniref:DNA mismatch repair protein MutS core domain-containing protein n=1 Tax=Rubus argutus TaxID=59490 RepID=A0AAW1X304_RUBAR
MLLPAGLFLGQFGDDLECSALSCLLSELRPVELVKPAELLSPETEKVLLRHTRSPLVNDELHADDSHMEEDGLGCLPDVLSELICEIELLPSSGFGVIISKPYMVLDAAALENLEIFENSRNGDSSGTITWLARPLYHAESITERQDAVSSLRGINLPYALEFRKAMSRLPDMERLLARVFSSSKASGRNANKVVLYEDAAKKQLQEFISALRGCELMAQTSCSLGVILENVESQRLHYLLTPGKGLPNVNSVLKHFKDGFDWAEANNSGRIIPHEGVDTEYDSACGKVKEIESHLTKYLQEQRKLLGDKSITYVTVGKDAYLLEVPESLRGSIPRDFELRSSKKGYFRYWTPNIKKSLTELSQAESDRESSLKSILQRLIGHFCEHHIKWRQLASVTAELDVLISLAIAND